jgi:hypothetical protein
MAVYDNSPLPWMKTKRVILHRNDSSAVQHCQLSTELRKLLYHSLVITLTENIQARVGPSASGTQAVSWDLARRWAVRFVDGYRRFRWTSCVYIVSWKWKEYVFFFKLDIHPQDCDVTTQTSTLCKVRRHTECCRYISCILYSCQVK